MVTSCARFHRPSGAGLCFKRVANPGAPDVIVAHAFPAGRFVFQLRQHAGYYMPLANMAALPLFLTV
jgi:hypothetical protein